MGLFMNAFARRLCWIAAASAIPISLVAQDAPDSGPAGDDRPVAQISARLAYNTEEEVLLGLGLRTDRLFGRDQSLSLDAEATQDSTRLSFNYLNSALAGESPRFGLEVFRGDRRGDKVYRFDSTVFGVVPRLTWALPENGTVSVFVQATEGKITDLTGTPSALIAADAGTQRNTMLGTEMAVRIPGTGGALIDTRLGFDLAYGESDRDHDYLRYTARAAMLHSLADGAVLVRSQISFGAIDTQAGVSSIGDRFMLGDASLRGFAFGGFGPRDLAAVGEPALGGNRYTVARFDAQFPAAFRENAARFVPGVFLDAGSLWGLDDTAGAHTVDDSAILRASVGVSLRIGTPLGPVEIYAAHPFEREDYDNTQTAGLSFNTRF